MDIRVRRDKESSYGIPYFKVVTRLSVILKMINEVLLLSDGSILE